MRIGYPPHPVRGARANRTQFLPLRGSRWGAEFLDGNSNRRLLMRNDPVYRGKGASSFGVKSRPFSRSSGQLNLIERYSFLLMLSRKCSSFTTHASQMSRFLTTPYLLTH